MNITFHGETATIKSENGHYKFLILGDGVLPYGTLKDVEITTYVRNYIKENHQDKITEIKAWQSLQEEKCIKH